MPDNPWLRSSPTEVDEPVAEASVLVDAPRTVAVSAPQHGVPVPDQVDRLPQAVAPFGATVWWLGAVGGSGESTMAAIARGSRAADHAWPMPANFGAESRVVLLARTNYRGLVAAQRAAIEWASGALGGAIRVEGLVLIPDAPGRQPKELRHLADVVAGGVPRTWALPWVDAWRFGPVDLTAELPKEFHTLLTDLHLNLNQSTN